MCIHTKREGRQNFIIMACHSNVTRSRIIKYLFLCKSWQRSCLHEDCVHVYMQMDIDVNITDIENKHGTWAHSSFSVVIAINTMFYI